MRHLIADSPPVAARDVDARQPMEPHVPSKAMILLSRHGGPEAEPQTGGEFSLAAGLNRAVGIGQVLDLGINQAFEESTIVADLLKHLVLRQERERAVRGGVAADRDKRVSCEL